MNTYFELENKGLCTGCRACEQICPKNCIDMIEDDEGFLYPKADMNKCINCNLCKKVCHIGCDLKNHDFKTECYAAVHKDEDVVMNSSSGGAFTGIAQAFCDENYAVFGACFSEDMQVRHDYVRNIDDIKKFRKSKYVLSEIGDSYKKVKDMMDDGTKVLFTGTPCQIAGLRAFLKKDYENLLTVDVICNGVPSPDVLKKYFNSLNGNVTGFDMRYKKKYRGEWLSIYARTDFKEKSKVEIKNQYKEGFLQGIFHRPCCYECRYTSPERVSDFTLADFWSVEDVNPSFPAEKGASLILVNTEKAAKLMNLLNENMYIEKSSVEFAVKRQPRLREPIKYNHKRDSFMMDMNKLGEKELFDKYIKMPSPLQAAALRIFPTSLKIKIKKIIKR